MTRFDTQLARLGRSSADAAGTINPPLARASTILFDTLDELREARAGTPFETLRYGLYGTGPQFELQAAMAELCGTESCLATASGMAGIAATLSAHARPGSRLLIQQDAYEPTRDFAQRQLAPTVDVRTFGSVNELAELMTDDTCLVFIELPTSATMRVIDVSRVLELARGVGAPVACDSTWGTPRYFDAHALGVDISIHAATKYIGGHSDLMLGLITGTHEALESTRAWCFDHGMGVAPDVCWLGLRGLRTLGVRLDRHATNALAVANWLETQPQVARVLFPVLPSDPDHHLWRSQFRGGAGPFSIELEPCDDAAHARFIESFELFGLGASWGGFASLVLPAISQARRALPEQPDEGRLVRLHIGLEDPADLIADLEQALAQL
jgi:cystathionine beta-lyase